jgi:hypothetical protein
MKADSLSLIEFREISLWIRRVLVRSQEGQLSNPLLQSEIRQDGLGDRRGRLRCSNHLAITLAGISSAWRGCVQLREVVVLFGKRGCRSTPSLMLLRGKASSAGTRSPSFRRAFPPPT